MDIETDDILQKDEQKERLIKEWKVNDKKGLK